MFDPAEGRVNAVRRTDDQVAACASFLSEARCFERHGELREIRSDHPGDEAMTAVDVGTGTCTGERAVSDSELLDFEGTVRELVRLAAGTTPARCPRALRSGRRTPRKGVQWEYRGLSMTPPRMPPDFWEGQELPALVQRLKSLRCDGVDDKTAEYDPTPEKLGDLLAELKLGAQLSTHLKVPVTFQTGDKSDIIFEAHGVRCTVEVEHKSTADPFGAVFHPHPDTLAWYAEEGQESWQEAAVRLNNIVTRLPIEVEPFTEGDLSEPRWGGRERQKQEECCGELANWLASQLEGWNQDRPVELIHALARFVITPLSSRPGRIAGKTMVSPSRIHEFASSQVSNPISMSQWFRKAIERKANIALESPQRCAAQHLVALVIDEAYASDGGVLANTLLGGLVWSSDEKKGYRTVPAFAQSLYHQSLDRGRRALLDLAQFDSNETINRIEGLFFNESICAGVDGVLALYYTGELQALLNPFTSRNIEPLRPLFPMTLSPFWVRAF